MRSKRSRQWHRRKAEREIVKRVGDALAPMPDWWYRSGLVDTGDRQFQPKFRQVNVVMTVEELKVYNEK